MNKQSRLTTYILIGLALGILTGYIAHVQLDKPESFADTMSLVTMVFLRLIKINTPRTALHRELDYEHWPRAVVADQPWFLTSVDHEELHSPRELRMDT